MYDTGVLATAFLVAFLPGCLLVLALGVRRPLLLVALAPGASVVLAGAVAIATSVLGLGFGAVPLGVVVGALAVVLVAVAWRDRAAGGWATPRRRVPEVGVLAGVVMTVVAVGFAGWSWLRGMGGLSTPSQEHDMIIHAVQTAYIARSGRAAPWELVPADVLTGEPVSFYPAGFHLLAAVTSDLTGDIISALNAMSVIFLAVVLCTGVAVLGAVAAHQLELGRGSAALVGGVAALVMAGMYRPAFHLMHDGGILANAAALALAPGVAAGIFSLPGLRWRAGPAIGIAAAGAVWVHPNAVVSVGLTVVAWWVGQAASPLGRRRLRGITVPLLAASAVGLVAVIPALAPGLGAAGRAGSFPPDSRPVSFRDALGSTVGLPFGGYFDPAQAQAQVWAVVLLVVGVASVIALRRGLGPVTAWATWTVIVVAAMVSPGTGFEAPITGFFYHAMLRTWSHVSLLVPVLAGLGVVIVVNRAAVLVRRRLPLPTRWTATGAATGVYLVYALVPTVGYANLNEESVASRYRTPEFVRVSEDDRRATDWLAQHVRPGERVFNSPNDGSTSLYVEAGIPVVNIYPLGVQGLPYSYRLLEGFNTYPENSRVRQQLVDLNVRWVYVDAQAPAIGSPGSPEGWAGLDPFSLAPGLANLTGLPGLTPAFSSGTVTVYALDLDSLPPVAQG